MQTLNSITALHIRLYSERVFFHPMHRNQEQTIVALYTTPPMIRIFIDFETKIVMNNRRVENNEFFRKKSIREWDFVPLIKAPWSIKRILWCTISCLQSVNCRVEAHYKHHTDLQRGYNWHCAKGKSQKHSILQDCFLLFDRARSQLELLQRVRRRTKRSRDMGTATKTTCIVSSPLVACAKKRLHLVLFKCPAEQCSYYRCY